MVNAKNFKSIWKVFFVWQDEEEEKWLRKMSLSGWHLIGTSSLIRYHFVKGEHLDYHYKLDFTYVSDIESYIDIFEKAGWEYVGKMFLWYYFRKIALDNEVPEIYSDNQSRIQRNNSILKVLYSVLLLNMVPAFAYISSLLFTKSHVAFTSILNVAASLLLVYAIFKIKGKNQMLRQQD